jgi:hypothetical protein
MAFSPTLNDHYVDMGLDDPLPKYDAYFTWKNFGGDADTDPDSALYVWQGKELGKGKEGFSRLLASLSAMPDGSVILVYPGWGREPGVRGGQEWPDPYPFSYDDEPDSLNEVLVKHHLVLAFSVLDHNGRLHPQCRGRWHWRWCYWTAKPAYDVYLTWKDYDGTGDAERAIFIWQGREVGKGSDGFRQIIAEMKKLRPKSRILVFPCYATASRDDRRDTPLVKFEGALGKELDDTVESRDLIILFSYRDQNGKIHPVNRPYLKE